jgi:hypothetical protein
VIRPTITFTSRSREQLVQAVRGQARPVVRRDLEEMGEEWEREIQKIINRDVLRRRDGVRHKANTTHLENSFTHRIEEGPNDGFPMRLVLTTKPGVNSKKIGALEHGNPPHFIPKQPKSDGFLRWGTAPGDIRTPKLRQVYWKPNPDGGRYNSATGYKIMQRARDRVLARRRRAR